MNCFILSVLLSLFTGTTTVSDAPPMLFHSTNKGEAWAPFDEGLPDGAVPRNIVANGDDLWLVTDNDGLFVLPAGKDAWEARNGNLPSTVFATAIAISGDLIAIGTYREGVWVSRDGGGHWYRSVFNLQHNAVWSLQFKEGLIVAGTDRGLYRSYDGGIAWIGDAEDIYQVSDIVEHNGKLFTARRNGIHMSKDGGDSWVQVFDDRPIYRVIADNELLYAFGGNTILRSENGGKTWKQSAQKVTDAEYDTILEALWQGIEINTPNDRSAREIFETKRGWFLGISPGC